MALDNHTDMDFTPQSPLSSASNGCSHHVSPKSTPKNTPPPSPTRRNTQLKRKDDDDFEFPPTRKTARKAILQDSQEIGIENQFSLFPNVIIKQVSGQLASSAANNSEQTTTVNQKNGSNALPPPLMLKTDENYRVQVDTIKKIYPHLRLKTTGEYIKLYSKYNRTKTKSNDRPTSNENYRAFGGTLILVKNSIKHYSLPTPSMQTIEATIVILTPIDHDPISIVSIYIPPRSDEYTFTIDIENLSFKPAVTVFYLATSMPHILPGIVILTLLKVYTKSEYPCAESILDNFTENSRPNNDYDDVDELINNTVNSFLSLPTSTTTETAYPSEIISYIKKSNSKKAPALRHDHRNPHDPGNYTNDWLDQSAASYMLAGYSPQSFLIYFSDMGWRLASRAICPENVTVVTVVGHFD
ncbi:hypothetical protein TNCV_3954211 [Trichonephila clavipes]|nr:hypothetical protein TNCV_3954211 [Trichonephila clavipes]